MAEKWRVCIVLTNTAGTGWSGLQRCKRDLAREMRARTGVLVAGAGDSGLSPVSAYTGSRAVAEQAAQVAAEVAGQHGFPARVLVECWRPMKKQWEEASERDLAEEPACQQPEERRVPAETGVARWRVRAELRTHRAAVALAERLSSDGHRVGRGWKYVVASAGSEDDARRLVEMIEHYAPSNADVLAEPADTSLWSEPLVPPSGGPAM